MADRDDGQVDDNPLDLTIYQLAERAAAGMPVSVAGHREIAEEVEAVQSELRGILRDRTNPHVGARTAAVLLLNIRTEIERLVVRMEIGR
jgi:hypothetical protein